MQDQHPDLSPVFPLTRSLTNLPSSHEKHTWANAARAKWIRSGSIHSFSSWISQKSKLSVQATAMLFKRIYGCGSLAERVLIYFFFRLFSFSQPWNVCNKSKDAIILMQVTCSKMSYWIKKPENWMVGREAGWRLDSKNMWGICFKFLSALFLKLFNGNMIQLIWLVGQLFYALVKSLMRAFRPFFSKTTAQEGQHDCLLPRCWCFHPPQNCCLNSNTEATLKLQKSPATCAGVTNVFITPHAAVSRTDSLTFLWQINI